MLQEEWGVPTVLSSYRDRKHRRSILGLVSGIGSSSVKSGVIKASKKDASSSQHTVTTCELTPLPGSAKAAHR